jgi:two-component system, NarL family, sensor kinase
VARELLTNVSRHANAHRVALDLFDEGDDVTLNVRDDGVGMDPAVLSRRLSEGHIGLASHRARIETLLHHASSFRDRRRWNGCDG